MKAFLLTFSFAAFGFVANAVDAVFTRQGIQDQQGYWADAANWKNANTGEALSEPPTNASDNVAFAVPHDNISLQRIGVGTGQETSKSCDIVVNSVSGNERHKICHSFMWSEGTSAKHRRLTVLNPNSFTGLWFAGDAHAVFSFPAAGSFVPEISALSANARPEVEVPAAGTSARLDALYNSGALIKLGAGDLTVGGTQNCDSRFYVKEGSLTLTGREEGEDLESLLKSSAFHLDATVSSSYSVRADGSSARVCVTNWCDVRGRGFAASVPGYVSRLKVVNAPFLAPAAGNGLDMIDFGSALADAESVALWGPTNCVMHFPQMDNVREVFYVAKYHKKPGFNAVIGDSVKPTLQPADAFLGGSANFGARTGVIFANGTQVDRNWWPAGGHGLTNLNVVSVGSPSNMVFSALATDQDYSERTGGMMIGEVLLYTNALSRAARMRVHAYLCNKWQRRDIAADADAGQVFLEGTEAAVGVAGGKATLVDLVANAEHKVVKTGSGTLEVDMIYPFNAVLDVRGGNIRFARAVPSVSAQAPASDPSVWLDASTGTSLTTETPDGAGRANVLSWKDRRGGELPAGGASEVKPTVAPGASATGLDVVDFGETAETYSYVKFPWWGDTTPRFKAGFAVVRLLKADRSFVPVFGSKNMTFMREGEKGGSHSRFISEKYTHPALGAALWTLNGVPQNPTEYDARLHGTSEFNVIAFSASENVLVDAVAWGRNNASYCGAMQVGEVILYDRELTDRERRGTEAYLMDKWLGKSHPAEAELSPSYVFGGTQPAVLDSDVDFTVGSIAGGTDELTKKGTGSILVGSDIASFDGRRLTVEGGVLEFSSVRHFFDEALFHFDASDSGSLVYWDGADGKPELAQWLDVRRNGIMATTVLNDAAGYVKCAPSLAEREVRPGVFMPMLDFGGVLGGSSAAMLINKTFANVREAHTVHQDRSKNSMFFSYSHLNPTSGSSAQYHDFYRATDGSFFGVNAAEALKNGYVATNGVPMASYTDIVPTAATLFSMAATADVHVNSIQYDRTVPGGAYVGEQLAFSRVLNERERDYLQKYLMWKWFGEGERPYWINGVFSSFAVSAGSSLRFSGNAVLSVSELSGAGTVRAGELVNVASVKADADDLAAGKHLAVDAALRFADNAAIEIKGSGRRLAPGDYTILSAVEIIGVQPLPACRLADVPYPETCRVIRDGNRLVLRVNRRAFSVTVR